MPIDTDLQQLACSELNLTYEYVMRSTRRRSSWLNNLGSVVVAWTARPFNFTSRLSYVIGNLAEIMTGNSSPAAMPTRVSSYVSTNSWTSISKAA